MATHSLQYSCLENPMDKGVWQATVRRVSKSWMRLSTHTESTEKKKKLCIIHSLLLQMLIKCLLCKTLCWGKGYALNI